MNPTLRKPVSKNATYNTPGTAKGRRKTIVLVLMKHPQSMHNKIYKREIIHTLTNVNNKNAGNNQLEEKESDTLCCLKFGRQIKSATTTTKC